MVIGSNPSLLSSAWGLGIQTGPFHRGSALLLIFRRWHRVEIILINFLPVASSSAFTNAYSRSGFSNDFTSRIRAKSQV